MLYFAYGMNTNRDGMAQRCPGALSLGHARLLDHRFRFAIHADVVPCAGSYVDGVLWTIDQFHLLALDTLEGYPWYYDRSEVTVEHRGSAQQAWCYFMQPGNLDGLPGQYYLDMVVQGYDQHQVPTDQLFNSLYMHELTEKSDSAIITA